MKYFTLQIYSQIISIIRYEILENFKHITSIYLHLLRTVRLKSNNCISFITMRPQIVDIHYHIYGLMVRGIFEKAFRKLTCPSSSLKVIKKPSLPFSSKIPNDWRPTVLYEGGNRGRALMKMESIGLHDEMGLMWMLANKALCVLKVKGEGRGQEK